jgi:hypothetical protein
MPLQTMATTAALTRISRALHGEGDGARQLVTSPAGQAIGLITQVRSCRHIVQEFRESFADALARTADGEMWS